MTRTAAALALAALALAVASGCSSADRPAAAGTPTPTTVTNLDGSGVRLARAPFCDRVTDTAVRAALGRSAASDNTWGNGDPVPADGPDSGPTGQVGHEFGCSWTAADGAAAPA
jgi:hypothetical protein